MDQKTIRKTSTLTGIIYLVLAILLIPMSISVLLSAKGIVLLGASVILLTGISCLVAFIRSISFRKEIRQIEQLHIDETSEQAAMQVSWQVSSLAWDYYLKSEIKRRTGGLLFESALIIVVGSVILMFSRPVGFYMSLFFTVPVALIYYFIKYQTLLSKLPKKGSTVIILVTPASVSFNQTIYPLNSSRFRVVEAVLKNQQQEQLLWITYQWPLRKGGYSEEAIRVPVPPDALPKAAIAIRLLLNQNAGH